MNKHAGLDSVFNRIIFALGIGVVGAFAALFAFAFFVVLPPERKAARIGETQAQFSEDRWKDIYREAVEFHKARYRGEPVFVELPEVLSPLIELGYDGCWLDDAAVTLKYGGGMMQNRALISIQLGSESHPWKRIYYSGGSQSGFVEIGGAEQVEDN